MLNQGRKRDQIHSLGAEAPRLCFEVLVLRGSVRISYYEHLGDHAACLIVLAVRLAVHVLAYVLRLFSLLLTARRVLTRLAVAASASPSSSWMGAFLMSSLNCGGGLPSFCALIPVSYVDFWEVNNLTVLLPSRLPRWHPERMGAQRNLQNPFPVLTASL